MKVFILRRTYKCTIRRISLPDEARCQGNADNWVMPGTLEFRGILHIVPYILFRIFLFAYLPNWLYKFVHPAEL